MTPLDKLNDGAKKAMRLAEEEARRMDAAHVDTGHILVGLALEGGTASRVLAQRGCGVETLRRHLASVAGPMAVDPTPGALPLSNAAHKALDRARLEAGKLKHDVGTRHLLLGVTWDTEGSASKVLGGLRVSSGDLRSDVMRQPSGKGGAVPAASPPPRTGTRVVPPAPPKAAPAGRTPSVPSRTLSGQAYVVPLELTNIFDLLGLPKATPASQMPNAHADRRAALAEQAQRVTGDSKASLEREVQRLDAAWKRATEAADAEESHADEAILSFQDIGLHFDSNKPRLIQRMAVVLRAEGFATEEALFSDLLADGNFDRAWAGDPLEDAGLRALVALGELPRGIQVLPAGGGAWPHVLLVLDLQEEHANGTVVGRDGNRVAVLASQSSGDHGCAKWTAAVEAAAAAGGARPGPETRAAARRAWAEGKGFMAGGVSLAAPECEMELLLPVKRVMDWTLKLLGDRKPEGIWVAGPGAASALFRRILGAKTGKTPTVCVDPASPRG